MCAAVKWLFFARLYVRPPASWLIWAPSARPGLARSKHAARPSGPESRPAGSVQMLK